MIGRGKELFNKRKKYTIFSGAISCVGKQRQKNEDNFLVVNQFNEKMEKNQETGSKIALRKNEWVAYAVFDGMGGEENGEIAALIATQAFKKQASSANMRSREDVERIARACFMEANRRVIEKQKEANSMVGTTGTVVFTNARDFKVFHLGDSRAYLYRNGIIGQITSDHTVAEFKIQTGVYRKNEPAEIKDRQKLVCYIGCDPDSRLVLPDESLWMSARPGDRILLCSDGLYDMCSDEEMTEIFNDNDCTAKMLYALRDAAMKNGGKDNITVILVTFPKSNN